MSYDIKCEILADDFLEDEPELRDRVSELAQHIQTAIEEWIEDAKSPAIEIPLLRMFSECGAMMFPQAKKIAPLMIAGNFESGFCGLKAKGLIDELSDNPLYYAITDSGRALLAEIDGKEKK